MKRKYKKLIACILFDFIGILSFLVPVLGEWSDVVWAPLSSYLIYKMFKGVEGKVASVISFVEEAGIMGTDLLPTFTLTWIYKYVVKKGN